MKILPYIIALFVTSTMCVAQPQEWSLVDGKARLQSVISVPDKDAAHLYKQVNRWLVATFKNPEDALKARVESEYLRGIGYHTDIYKLGAHSGVDFQYTFVIDIRDCKVRLTLSNGVVLYDDPQEYTGPRRIEHYIDIVARKKRDRHAQEVLAAINTMSAGLFTSLENFLVAEYASSDDW